MAIFIKKNIGSQTSILTMTMTRKTMLTITKMEIMLRVGQGGGRRQQNKTDRPATAKENRDDSQEHACHDRPRIECDIHVLYYDLV